MANPIPVKIVSCLSRLIEANVPVIVANANQEEERFWRNEHQVLTKQNRICCGYVFDASNRLLCLETGHEMQLTGFIQAINWFVYGKPAEDLTSDESDLSRTGPFRNPENCSREERKGSILFLFDVLSVLQDPNKTGHSNAALTRILKNASKELQFQKKTIVLVNNKDYCPPELEHVVGTVNFPLPGLDYLRSTVRNACSWFPEALDLSEEEEIDVATLLNGFRLGEATSILARSVQENTLKRSKDKSIPMGFDLESLRNEKIRIASNLKGVTLFIPETDKVVTGTQAIGGMKNIVDWFTVQNSLYTEEARRDGIESPRGAVICGPGGVGKDWIVRRLAEHFGWNTLLVDLGALDDKFKGETHRAFMDALEAAGRCTPCFLVFSEFEKMFDGAFSGSGSASGDSTDSKIYATFLNWMADKKSQVFVWALTNGIDKIPAPALRSGRFDKVFFMDLPNVKEREEVFRIHLKRRNWDPEFLDLDFIKLTEKTDEFSNAEIANVVNQAIILKFIRDGSRDKATLTMDHLLEAIEDTTPMSVIDPEDLKNIREYAADKKLAKANSDPKKQTSNRKQKKIGAALASSI